MVKKNEDIKHFVFLLCVVFVLLGAFAGVASATTWHVEECESIQAVDGAAMPFYNNAIRIHHMPFDHMIDEKEEYLAHTNHLSFYKDSIPKHKLNKQIIRKAGTQKSNYTFSLHGKVNLLWSFVNDERNAEVDFDILDDVNGDGIEDVVISDYNSANKTLLVSGKDGSVIWSKSYPHRIDLDTLGNDVNGDGIEDIIVSWDEYNSLYNETNVTIELLSGGNGMKIWSRKISYEGEYWVGVHGTGGDISGDGTEDILIEVGSWKIDVTVLHALNSKDSSTLWKRIFTGHASGYYWTWEDLTGDGINDFVVRSYRRDDNTGEVYVIRGFDGSTEWHKSFIGELGYPEDYIDFDGDGLNDIEIENNDFKNNTGKYVVLKGTDGSVIWSKSFNYRVWGICYFSDFNGDEIEERCLKLENFTTGRIEEIQVLGGIDGCLILKKGVNVSQVGYSKDLNGDGKDDILFSNSTEVGKNKYLYDVIAISGVDGNVIWKNSFSHEIEIEIPESEHWHEWSYPSGWQYLNGDGIADPLLIIGSFCFYRDENTSTYCTYDAGKLILINGKDGSEIGDVECTADEDILLSTRTWIDFNKDEINDVLLGTRKGVYLLTTSETPINQPPIASFIYSSEKTRVNQTVTFDASASYDPDGEIVAYEWDFGDGNVTSMTEKIINHSYTTAGNYNVNLTVTDNDELTNSTKEVVKISEPLTLGKGIWIWRLSEAEGGNVSAIIERCKNIGIEWVAIKCGDGRYFWSQCKPSTIKQFQNAGIKVFGWQYVYGDDPIAEANISNQILDTGVDGFIIDAEGEYEGKPDNAITYLEKIREEHSDSFIAYTPFPIRDYHTDFPYLEFGKYCDAVMPQDYWKEIGVTPEYMVEWMEEQWDKWHTIWEGGGYGDSIKPIIPLGQGWDVSGSEITIFCNLIYDHGYGGVSLWRYETMTEENWKAYAECFALPTAVFDTGASANPYPSITVNYTGTIKPNHTIIATKLYTYPCEGTGGHTEYAKVWNLTWNATATWKGYVGDWHNLSFDKTIVLLPNKTYDYTIRTGSYPQIIHKSEHTSLDGSFINCTKFTDANGRIYTDWIPAIRLE